MVPQTETARIAQQLELVGQLKTPNQIFYPRTFNLPPLHSADIVILFARILVMVIGRLTFF